MPPIAGSKAGLVYVNELGDDKQDNPQNNQDTKGLHSQKDYSNQNHISNSKSNMSLRQQLLTSIDSNKSRSVTSLSVGVQCNPCDVSNVMKEINRSSSGDIIKANSRTALISYDDNEDDEDEEEDNDGSVISNVHQRSYDHRSCKHHQQKMRTRKSYSRPDRRVHPKYHLQNLGISKNLHYSDPDFRLSSHQDEDDDDDDDVAHLIESQYQLHPRKQILQNEDHGHYHLQLKERYKVYTFDGFLKSDGLNIIRIEKITYI